MTGPWRVVDLSELSGEVHAAQGALLVGDERVPLVDVAMMLTGPYVSLHGSVIDRAAAFGVGVVHCDWRGVPVAATLPWSTHNRVAARHRAQAELSLPRQKNAWMNIVKTKIRNQAAVLRALRRDGVAQLERLAAQVRSGDASNAEGAAARVYWARLFQDKHFRRVPRARDVVNGLLDYGYAILRGCCLRAVVGAGLAPSLGLWHRRHDNPFTLVDDLIEPFRPAVDKTVIEIVTAGASGLDRPTKRLLVAVLDHQFDASGATVGTAVERFAQQVGRYVEGEIRSLRPPAMELSHA
ncbi:CRISPR-associated protein, Cas1 family [Acidothermus cellulolyticus 11B]|uniref:CRISPR-associated endonuclease Cas1 n=1 Tax=Acidothermus cellulolyticus (strain ATCC 43068 / DSM 8971 / 11B) TaxID=351607 RepID=A0LWB2_ACIC1|nr:CRISPR-associated protein, Cas1 family [Acidothermus cellulolyticus 11B]